MTPKGYLLLALFTACSTTIVAQQPELFKVRAITAGITLEHLDDTASFNGTIKFLKRAKAEFVKGGYAVQTLRISTNNVYNFLGKNSAAEVLKQIVVLDKIAQHHNISLSVGQILSPGKEDENISRFAEDLIKQTRNTSITIAISSKEFGIHASAIKSSAETIQKLSRIDNGDGNFRFAATANCPANIPFFPAAFHEGEKSFAIGLEYPNLLTHIFMNAEKFKSPSIGTVFIKRSLEEAFSPVEALATTISSQSKWRFDGIDTSPAPGLQASIGEAIESYTKKPFGSSGTLQACAMITDVIKTLDIKTCGYSGLMLPVIEDKILAKRATEGLFTVQELLLYSAVSGTGLDVVPLPGDTSIEYIENLLKDVAALSLKYNSKALSARLFLIPGKKAGDMVTFSNPYLTSCKVMSAE